jgi:RNA polymerase sigma-70 factor, ECF subfamily
MGDPPGFEAFFEDHHDEVVRALTLVFGERAAAEDAAQVGFERAFARWQRVGAYDRPATWVYVVALRHGRRQLRPREVSSGPEHALAGDHAQESVDRLAIIEQVLRLPPQQRAVVVMRHLVGLPLAEIAHAMGLKLGTVKSTLHAAHERLRVAAQDRTDEVEVRDAR